MRQSVSQVCDRPPEDAFKPSFIATDEKVLTIFDYMNGVAIRSISQVCKIKHRSTIVPGGINHFTERGIFIPFSARLDHETGKPPVEDGVKSINVNLTETPGGFSVWFKEGIRIIQVAKTSTAELSQAMNRYVPLYGFTGSMSLNVQRGFAKASLFSLRRCL